MPNESAKIILAATHGKLTKVKDALAVEGTINALKVGFQFRTPDWDNTTKTVVFVRGRATPSTTNADTTYVMLDENNECYVPSEILNSSMFSVGVFGTYDDYRIVSNWMCYKITDGCYADGSTPIDPSSTIYEQIISILKNKSNINHKHDERYYTKDQSNDKFLTEEDLPVTSVNQKTGDVVLSAEDVGAFANAVDEQGNQVQTIPYAAIKDVPAQIQSDWNQNNSNSVDYIKNRPFYEYEGLTVTEITTYEQANEAVFQYKNGTLKMVINEVEYTDFTLTSGTYTWELSTSDGAYSMTGAYNDNSLTFTPSDAVWVMYANTITIVPIDEKYIPNTIARDADKMNARNPSGTGSFSMNRKADTTIGSYSSTVGRNNTASGKYSHAEGGNSVASGDYSHTEGSNTDASGFGTHAEGSSTHATARASHAEGEGTRAEGDYSHAEGSSSQSYGTASHAEGRYAIARGNYSHAEGGYVEAGSPYQHVQGKNNIIDTESRYAHIVGNGVSNGARHNAHTLDWSGNAWFAGTVKVGGTGQDDVDAKTIATKEDIDATKPKSATITLLAANWVGDASPYSQVVTIADATANTMIDLLPTPAQLAELQANEITLMMVNDDGVVTAYALNAKPTQDYEIPMVITETR